jgi:hypothetical protein
LVAYLVRRGGASVEYRNDLADILLSGLPSDERDHVVGVIHETDAAVLRRKRIARDEVGQEPGHTVERTTELGE